jgi:PKD repeat protein
MNHLEFTVVTRRFFAFAALIALGGCSLDKQGPGSFTGPSETGISIAVTASPDVITQDGVSQSTIQVAAFDPMGQPMRGLSMRVETAVPNGDGLLVPVDIGSLGARTISTNNDGRASVQFVAPPPPPPTAGSDTVVTIIVTPIGSNFQNASPRTVAVRLARPGVILPPNGAPVPQFFFSPTQPKEGDLIVFDASGSRDDGQIVAYSWVFGDGETGSGVRPSHRYEEAGQYAVVLTVTDDRGNSVSSDPVAIVVQASSEPIATFAVSPSDPIAGQQVNVNASASRPAAGRRIVAYEWDFGDGSGIQNGITQAHVYSTPGNYVITLLVTDDLGKTDAASQDVVVKSSGPQASFTMTPASPTVGVSVSFSASGTIAQPGRTITSYQWDFGDGTTGSNVTTTKTYTAAGTYTVTLLVTDSAGQTGTISRTITVNP